MVSCKAIFKGQLEFGNAKSYEKVRKMYQHRAEVFYKSDLLLKEEDVFDDVSFSLNVPHTIITSTEKSWKNTLSLLEYLAQFAIAGHLVVWKTALDSGAVLDHHVIEPVSDKGAVQDFLKGRELVKVEGMQEEARDALNKAIDKFERHAQAYERRGRVNYLLKNFDDALYDYTKSINLNPTSPKSFYGRAFVHLVKGQAEAAVEDLEKAIKNSIPIQPIYWKARRIKGECHIRLRQYDKAAFEFKFFTKRQFKEDDPNFKWRKNALLNYAKALIELGDFQLAIQELNKAIGIPEDCPETPLHDLLFYRGIALKKAGGKDFEKDWAEAARLGCREAATLMGE